MIFRFSLKINVHFLLLKMDPKTFSISDVFHFYDSEISNFSPKYEHKLKFYNFRAHNLSLNREFIISMLIKLGLRSVFE